MAAARAPDLVGFAAILVNLSLLVSARSIPHRRGPVAPGSKCYERTMIPAPLQNILDRLTVAWHERAIALKAISFALVGVINTVIDFSIFWTAATYLQWPLVPGQRAGLAGGGVVFLCDEFLHHLRSGIGPRPALARLCHLRRLRRRRHGGQHRDAGCAVLCVAGAGGQAAVDPGELRGQFLALPFRGVRKRAARKIPKK